MREASNLVFKEYSGTILAVNTDKGSQFYANNKNDEGDKALAEFEKYLGDNNLQHLPSRRNHPQTNGKQERWFRTYSNPTKFLD
jgi:hypothetical protein